MSVDISGLDIAIRRMQTIERQFASLSNMGKSPDVDFQSILNSKLSSVQSSEGQNKTFYSQNSTTKADRGEIENLIEKYSDKNGLDKDFVKALVKQESGFNPNATSKCGAMGLMQLMPGTAQGLGVTNPYDVEQNIAGGTKYLRSMIDKFNGNEKLALAAYNAGPNAVKKYGGIPPYQETQNYVKNVMSMYQGYKVNGGTN